VSLKSGRSRSRSDLTATIVSDYFLFHRERYIRAMSGMEGEESRAMEVLAWELRDEVSDLVSTASIIFLPVQARASTPYAKFLVAREFRSATTLIELLRSNGDVIRKEFGITSGQLLLLGRKQIRAEKRMKESTRAGVSAGPVDAGVAVDESANTVYEYDSEDATVVLRLVFAEADKRGILRKGKDLVLVSSTDLALLGGDTVARAASGLENTRVAVGLPVSPEEAAEVYKVLSMPGTASMFMWNADPNRVIDAVVTAILSHDKVPVGLKKLVDVLLDTDMIWPAVKRIAQGAGQNPVLVYLTVREWLALLYGYMNRRADKLFEDIRRLRSTGRVALAEKLEREFERLVYRTVNLALQSVVGTWKTVSGATITPSYVSQLKPLVAGLDTETLEEMDAVLRGRGGREEVVRALFSLGAFNVGPRQLYLTVVGRALQVMIASELKRRGTRRESS